MSHSCTVVPKFLSISLFCLYLQGFMYEVRRGVSEERLRQYVIRWHRWLHGGLDGMVSTKGGTTKYWVYVLKHLHITGATVQT